ncbi:hypothetical protein FQZ97_920150 [compost metagenome]
MAAPVRSRWRHLGAQRPVAAKRGGRAQRRPGRPDVFERGLLQQPSGGCGSAGSLSPVRTVRVQTRNAQQHRPPDQQHVGGAPGQSERDQRGRQRCRRHPCAQHRRGNLQCHLSAHRGTERPGFRWRLHGYGQQPLVLQLQQNRDLVSGRAGVARAVGPALDDHGRLHDAGAARRSQQPAVGRDVTKRSRRNGA